MNIYYPKAQQDVIDLILAVLAYDGRNDDDKDYAIRWIGNLDKNNHKLRICSEQKTFYVDLKD